MTYLLQNAYIAVLNPIYSLTKKLSTRIRKGVIQFLCFCMPMLFILRHASILSPYLKNETHYQIVGTIILLLLIIFSINAPLHMVPWRKIVLYPMVLSGILIILISCIHTVGSGYRLFGLMLIFLYPCLCFVWNNRKDYEQLFIPLSIAICLVNFIIYAYCFYLASMGNFPALYENRYAGPLNNPNFLSMIGMMAFCASLYLIYIHAELDFRFVLLTLSIGAGFSLVTLGQSRLSILVCIVNAVVVLFFYLKYSRKGKKRTIILKLIVLCSIFILTLFTAHFMVLMQHSFDAVAPADTPTSEQAVASEPVAPNGVLDRFDVDDSADANSFTSGRILIWKSYADHLTLLGNNFCATDWNTMAHDPSHHAHNNFLEMAYRFGVPVGILYILLELFAGIIALQYLFFNRYKNPTLLFPILIMVMFVFESMLEVATLSFERIAPCYYFFALIPIIDPSLNSKKTIT